MFIFLLVDPTLLIGRVRVWASGALDRAHLLSRGETLTGSNYSDALDPDFLPIFIRSIVYARRDAGLRPHRVPAGVLDRGVSAGASATSSSCL